MRLLKHSLVDEIIQAHEHDPDALLGEVRSVALENSLQPCSGRRSAYLAVAMCP